MATTRIVEAVDVFPDVVGRVVPAPVLPSMNPFFLQRSEEALHGRVVPAIAFSAHAGHRAGLYEAALVVVRSVLAPAIRMMDEPLQRLSNGQGFVQSSKGQEAVDVIAGVPAHDL